MNSLSPPIRTERLVLRYCEARDLDDLYEFHSDVRITPYLYWDARDREQTRQALDKKLGQTGAEQDGDTLCLAMALQPQGKVIGELSLHCLSRAHRQGEFGFVLSPAYQGRGYATEGARAVLELGFSVYDFHRIIGRTDARNEPSYKLMERLGMRREAHFVDNEIFKGEWGSELYYAILAREWAAKSS
ncbi:GNAT family N-acetyltransferase [Haliangium ochraceum]|uniref:GCN5-related N-acetyltransferase n=1 Tax=Haliangium ochraceum (strain DSM 14365 / JCM 11303 / SMP-2) TaxID=502025 RepID=D0LUN8_HALO1|nr:GNAT family protein [Haliangium ochraceum]ACY13928.1 GCN5-related N-acetyltransferase [Haliangium ochraceum DSM 14365]